jgi:predicted nucleic acid-binding protein
MNLYIDSSVILRRLLGQAGAIPIDDRYAGIVTSSLSEVECMRTLDRVRLREYVDESKFTYLREAVYKQLEGMSVVEVTRGLLQRASHPLPTALGTLDAIHLATASSWRDHSDEPLTLATHDRALATAARATGFAVVGI